MAEETTDILEPMGSAMLLSPQDVVDQAEEIIRHYQRITREPTSNLGDFVYSLPERYSNRGGGFTAILDHLINKLSSRIPSSGSEVDTDVASRASSTSLLPLRGRQIPFRISTSFRFTFPPDRDLVPTALHREWGLVNAAGEPRRLGRPIPLDWKKAKRLLTEALQAGVFTDPDEVRRVNELILGPDRTNPDIEPSDEHEILSQLWGNGMQIPSYKAEWAQPNKEFDVKLAWKGAAFWIPDRPLMQKFTHRYEGFLSPPKWWLNRFIKWYFKHHPRRADLERAARLTRVKFPTSLIGNGPLRHYAYEEVTDFPGDSDEVLAQKADNRALFELRWWLWWHLDQARQYAFDVYTSDLKWQVLCHRRFRRRTLTASWRNNRIWELAETSNPFRAIDRAYSGYHVWMPPSYQYKFWQYLEGRIQHTDESDGQLDSQKLWERNYAVELCVMTLRWAEKLPRVWKNGRPIWAWYADPNHKGPDGKHCQGCPHTAHWRPAPEMVPGIDNRPAGVPAHWVYEEGQSWYPTRQELQLLRKVIYTHNSGSGFYDIFSEIDGVSEGDAKTLRNNYFFSGNETVPGRDLWWPGAADSDNLDDKFRTVVEDYRRDHRASHGGEDPSQYEIDRVVAAAYFDRYPGIVDREWFLGPQAGFWRHGEQNPFNSYGLDSWDTNIQTQDSRKKTKELLRQNKTRVGLSYHHLLDKWFEDIGDFDDALLFPDFKSVPLNDPVPDRGPLAGRKWQDVKVTFDPDNPKIERFNNIGFNIDPGWYERRNAFSLTNLRKWQDKYNQAFDQQWSDGNRRLGDDKRYIITWPNGYKQVVTGFRNETFRRYLIANWMKHQNLAKDFWQNQDAHEVEHTIHHQMEEIVTSEGSAELRPTIYKSMEGLPLHEPLFDDQGRQIGTQLSDFGRLKQALLREADNHLWKYILVMAEGMEGARGVKPGDGGKYLLQGFGQGYGSAFSQLRRVLRMVELGVKAIYYDTWKGIVEAFQLKATHEVINQEDVMEALEGALKSRHLNWRYARRVAADLKVLGILKGHYLIPREVARASYLVEKRWKREVLNLVFDGDPQNTSRALEATQKQVLWLMGNRPEDIATFEADDAVQAEQARVRRERAA